MKLTSPFQRLAVPLELGFRPQLVPSVLQQTFSVFEQTATVRAQLWPVDLVQGSALAVALSRLTDSLLAALASDASVEGLARRRNESHRSLRLALGRYQVTQGLVTSRV